MKELRDLQSGEIRVIKIGHEAIMELIIEALMVYGNGAFGLPNNEEDDDNIFSTRYNKDTQSMTFVAYKVKDYNKVDMDSIDRSIDITANSMFDDLPYIVKYLSKDSDSKI